MKQYRITKYDPVLRDPDGAYLGEDWTSASDVGETFGGVTLTAADYLKTETDYIGAVLRFFEASQLPHLRATCLENRFAGQRLAELKADQPDLYDPAFEEVQLQEDQMLERPDIALVCRMVLRDVIWCKLELADCFYVHFGWDYYMYLGTPANLGDSVMQTVKTGLFVENSTSPHTRPPGSTPRFTLATWNAQNGDHLGDIELTSPSVRDIQNALGFSHEHPACGTFTLSAAQVTRLQPFVEARLEPDRFDYQLDAMGSRTRD